MVFVRSAAKAFVGAIIALVGGLAFVITGDEGFSDVTTNEWLIVAGEALAVFVGVYFVPNK